ncbi:ATP-binding cassette domain-containing protein [Shewanella sp. UCD-KL12]|uniref:ATP-binding cassette domain-containing protein n=1 Tax=Shewanella sp. UCD-KL12 TaxID=1917163 RepID=UPI00097131E7|nr:ATP-binding cassette domain-containing protein [Shewanella sp. UCD-KL12]
MLNIDKLSIRSDEVELLSPICFKLCPGQVVGVIGASGSGKSLLASAIIGDIPKGFTASGKVTICNTAAASEEQVPHSLARVALAAQSATALDPLRTIFSQISHRIKRITQRKIASNQTAKPSHISNFVSEQIGRCYPHQLSGGMAKRALLAQASCQQSEYILADEPCCGLDSRSAQEIYTHLADYAKQENRGVLVISHNLKQLLAVADEILVLQEGKLVDSTRPELILTGMCHSYTQALWQALPENWHKDKLDYAEVA